MEESWLIGFFGFVIMVLSYLDKIKITQVASIVGQKVFDVVEQGNSNELSLSMKLLSGFIDQASIGKKVTEPTPKNDFVLEGIAELKEMMSGLNNEVQDVKTIVGILDTDIKENQRKINHIGAGNTLATLPVIE